jgi:anion-transporting  ArsA/GET3 family ATPase
MVYAECVVAQVHFVSGKGGVGKSTLAAAYTLNLYKKSKGPILFLDIQGKGYGFNLLGESTLSYKNFPVQKYPGIFLSRLTPMESFKEYFHILLTLGKEDALLSQLTTKWREELVDFILENKAIHSFVKACPGLEPIVLLGKIYWEARNGHDPLHKQNWEHIIVDAPASGHFLMLFNSTLALKDIFHSGIIHSQADKLQKYILDPQMTHIYLATLLEELPIQEMQESIHALKKMSVNVDQIWVNRFPELDEVFPNSTSHSLPSKEWHQLKVATQSLVEEQNELWKKIQNNFSITTKVIPEILNLGSSEIEKIGDLLS